MYKIGYMKYNEDYHNGRHACREKYVKSGLLVINPDIDIDALCESPCVDCPEYNKNTKLPCVKTDTCGLKQKQLTAIEIKRHFRTLKEQRQYGPNECCLTCANYVFWDGDYCCVPKFKILSFGDEENESAIIPERVITSIKGICKEYKKNEIPLVLRNNIAVWNLLNPNHQYKYDENLDTL